jgi:protein-disulfide isomerase
VPRITVDDLTATDAVLVTPDKREPILGRIDGTPARVVLPEDVLLGRVR